MTNKDINLFDLQVENAINLQRNGEFEQARLIYEKLLNKSINKFKILYSEKKEVSIKLNDFIKSNNVFFNFHDLYDKSNTIAQENAIDQLLKKAE